MFYVAQDRCPSSVGQVGNLLVQIPSLPSEVKVLSFATFRAQERLSQPGRHRFEMQSATERGEHSGSTGATFPKVSDNEGTQMSQTPPYHPPVLPFRSAGLRSVSLP